VGYPVRLDPAEMHRTWLSAQVRSTPGTRVRRAIGMKLINAAPGRSAWQPATTVLLLLMAATAVDAQYRFEHWDTHNGLPQISVVAVTQTPDGYVWVATRDGLVRFDGIRFTAFNKTRSPGMDTNRLSTLFCDREGRLWIGVLYSLTSGSFNTAVGTNNWSSIPRALRIRPSERTPSLATRPASTTSRRKKGKQHRHIEAQRRLDQIIAAASRRRDRTRRLLAGGTERGDVAALGAPARTARQRLGNTDSMA
jgi:hypothetical protein